MRNGWECKWKWHVGKVIVLYLSTIRLAHTQIVYTNIVQVLQRGPSCRHQQYPTMGHQWTVQHRHGSSQSSRSLQFSNSVAQTSSCIVSIPARCWQRWSHKHWTCFTRQSCWAWKQNFNQYWPRYEFRSKSILNNETQRNSCLNIKKNNNIRTISSNSKAMKKGERDRQTDRNREAVWGWSWETAYIILPDTGTWT